MATWITVIPFYYKESFILRPTTLMKRSNKQTASTWTAVQFNDVDNKQMHLQFDFQFVIDYIE